MIAWVSIVRATNKSVDLRPRLRMTFSGCRTGVAGTQLGADLREKLQKRKKAASKRAMSERRAPPRGLSV